MHGNDAFLFVVFLVGFRVKLLKRDLTLEKSTIEPVTKFAAFVVWIDGRHNSHLISLCKIVRLGRLILIVSHLGRFWTETLPLSNQGFRHPFTLA